MRTASQSIQLGAIGLCLLLLTDVNVLANAQNSNKMFNGGVPKPVFIINTLEISQSSPNILFSVINNNQLFRTDDSGITWLQVYTTTSRIRSLAIDPFNSNVVYLGNDEGLYRSTNGGSIFDKIYSNSHYIIVASPTLIYNGSYVDDNSCVLGYGFNLVRSQDGGEHWDEILNSCDCIEVQMAVDPSNPNILYMSGRTVVGGTRAFMFFWKSPDGGRTWDPFISFDLLVGNWEEVTQILIDPADPKTLYIALTWSIVYSHDGGLSWRFIEGLPAKLYALAKSGSSLIAIPRHITCVYFPPTKPSSVYRSEDNGLTWWQSVSTLPYYLDLLVSDPKQPGRIYAGLCESGIYSTNNYGSAWVENNRGFPGLYRVWFPVRNR
jgi:photosystem II stability/assembly factor-like uncharacterized protein